MKMWKVMRLVKNLCKTEFEALENAASLWA